ncbi:MAG: prolyl oligopeptidase family serine peptidase [Verrucomicrobiales bacterium]|nr:prolyl oligopeptidase family serine peptidase [Verrucomicrobiales bacterium]
MYRFLSHVVAGRTIRVIPLCALMAIAVASYSTMAATAPPRNETVLREGLLIKAVARSGRSAFHTDAIEERIVSGRWSLPKEGETIDVPNAPSQRWEKVKADTNGWFANLIPRLPFTNSGPRGGYLYLPYSSPRNEVLLLHAAGHSMAYVNGEPRAGDLYENGTAVLPVQMQSGLNEILLATGRGRIRAKLSTPAASVQIALHDTTLPDILRADTTDKWGSIILINSTTNTQEQLVLHASVDGQRTESTSVPAILPLTTRKVGFRLRHSGESRTNRASLELTLTRRGARSKPIDTAKLSLRVREPDQSHRETFVSQIDGSVQYYAITPARPVSPDRPARALVLSTHGASVEAQGQAEAYAPKPWAHVVAPTNRRPYGFDWEDWGRWDAIEVLEHAQKKFNTDAQLTYLTGHSMGGHGTWQLGATFPDRFAGIAPSAGWISFFSYAGGRRDESTNAVRALLQRSTASSDTLLMASNYLNHAIYILHGDADDNVPVSEARTMRKVLEPFHRDFMYHEQPGAGHWWGNPCVDWPPIFDLFARHRIPDWVSKRAVHFTTVNPGISSSSHWVAIEAQDQALAKSIIDIAWDPNARTFTGNSENVQRLRLQTTQLKPGKPVQLKLDGQSVTNVALPGNGAPLWFSRQDGNWRQVSQPPPRVKGPVRSGPFKEAFNHRFLFVYGTQGTAPENAWALAKARFDGEAFWYRGNGSIDIIPDTQFRAKDYPDRGVILYGNADSNKAWRELLPSSPVQIRRGLVQIGNRSLSGDGLACLFLQPRPDSDIACVGVVGGTGVAGMKLTDRVPYFLAGVAFPDCTVFGLESLSQAADGARVAGFFGTDWSVTHGEFVWRDEPAR